MHFNWLQHNASPVTGILMSPLEHFRLEEGKGVLSSCASVLCSGTLDVWKVTPCTLGTRSSLWVGPVLVCTFFIEFLLVPSPGSLYPTGIHLPISEGLTSMGSGGSVSHEAIGSLLHQEHL